MKGMITLACNCDYGCPCNFNARPTHGHCEGEWTWHVAEGRYGDTPLAALNFTLAADWPGAIHEGNGEALLVVDERADAAQRQAIQTLLGGGVGGPWAILVNTLSKVHGPMYAPYEVALEDLHSRVRAGQILELELTPIKNPVTGAEVYPRVVLPQGFVWKEAGIAASKAFRVSDGVRYDHTGKYAALAAFEYSGPPA
jgi:hypothetical protein